MITGKGTLEGEGYPYAGRPAEKYYLYEIISNKLTGKFFSLIFIEITQFYFLIVRD